MYTASLTGHFTDAAVSTATLETGQKGRQDVKPAVGQVELSPQEASLGNVVGGRNDQMATVPFNMANTAALATISPIMHVALRRRF